MSSFSYALGPVLALSVPFAAAQNQLAHRGVHEPREGSACPSRMSGKTMELDGNGQCVAGA
jgi:hypothetical protein